MHENQESWGSANMCENSHHQTTYWENASVSLEIENPAEAEFRMKIFLMLCVLVGAFEVINGCRWVVPPPPPPGE